MRSARVIDAVKKCLVFFRREVLIELPAQRGNHSEAVWYGLLANVHALDQSIFQRVDVVDHSIQQHFAR